MEDSFPFGSADSDTRTESLALKAGSSNVILVGVAFKDRNVLVSDISLDVGSGLAFTELAYADDDLINAAIWGVEVPSLTAGPADLTINFSADARHAFKAVQLSGATLAGAKATTVPDGTSATLAGLSAGDAVFDLFYENTNGAGAGLFANFNNSTAYSMTEILAADGDYTTSYAPTNNGTGSFAVVAIAPIPEPSTLISLFVGGLLGVVLLRRFR